MSQSPSAQFLDMSRGHWMAQVLHVTLHLSLPDRLALGEKSLSALAQECDAHPDSLSRLLRALQSLGIVEKTASGYGLSPSAQCLTEAHPESIRAAVLMQFNARYMAWGDLLHSVTTGQSAFRKVHGQSVYDWNTAHPEFCHLFDSAMAQFSSEEMHALLEAYDFGPYRHIVDLGGGRGLALQRLLTHHPHLQGTLFERPQVIEACTVPPALKDRLHLHAGDFFSHIPEQGDGYLLKNVLHNWDDTACLNILNRAAQALKAPNARLMIYECLMREDTGQPWAALKDLNMLVLHEGGRERTLSEYESLLMQSGLELEFTHPTDAGMHLLIARRRS